MYLQHRLSSSSMYAVPHVWYFLFRAPELLYPEELNEFTYRRQSITNKKYLVEGHGTVRIWNEIRNVIWIEC